MAKAKDNHVSKSLHTITVLQQVTAIMQTLASINDPEKALDAAMDRLGLANRPDPHGLRAAALSRLLKAA
jgi:hypothetical protein